MVSIDIFNEAILASKSSRKQNCQNFAKIKKQFWKLVRLIRKDERNLTEEQKAQLLFHMNKMK